MQVLRNIIISILQLLLLVGSICNAQDSTKGHFTKGVEYGMRGEFIQAKEEFERAAKLDKFDFVSRDILKVIEDVMNHKITRKAAIHLFHGASSASKDLYDQAISDCTKAIKINTGFAVAFNERGASHAGKGHYDKAISDYSKAIELNPHYDVAYCNRGNAYYKGKAEYDKAILDFSKAIELNPQYDDAYYNRGFVYHQGKKQYDNAISDYSRTIELNPRYCNAYNNRGFIYMIQMGNKRMACSDWEMACKLGNCKNYTVAKQKGDCD